MSKKTMFPSYLPQFGLDREEIGIQPAPHLPARDAKEGKQADDHADGAPKEQKKEAVALTAEQKSRQEKLLNWLSTAMSDHVVIIQADEQQADGKGEEKAAEGAEVIPVSSNKIMSSNAGYQLGSGDTADFDGVRLRPVAEELFGSDEPMRKSARTQQLAYFYQAILTQHPKVAVLGLQEIDTTALDPFLSQWPGGQWKRVPDLKKHSEIKILSAAETKLNAAGQLQGMENNTPNVVIYQKPRPPRTGISFSAWLDELLNRPPLNYHYYFIANGVTYEGQITDAKDLEHLRAGQATQNEHRKELIKNITRQQFGQHNGATPIFYDPNKYEFKHNLGPAVSHHFEHSPLLSAMGGIHRHHFDVAILLDKETKQEVAFVNVHLRYNTDISQSELFVQELVVAIRANYSNPAIEVNVFGDFNIPAHKVNTGKQFNITNLSYLTNMGLQRENRCDSMLRFPAVSQPVQPQAEAVVAGPPPWPTVLPVDAYDSAGELFATTSLISPDLHLGDDQSYREPHYFQPSGFSSFNITADFETALANLIGPTATVRVRLSADQHIKTQQRLCLFNLPSSMQAWLNRAAGLVRETTLQGRSHELGNGTAPGGFYHFDVEKPSHRHELIKLFFEYLGTTHSIPDICRHAGKALEMLLTGEVYAKLRTKPVTESLFNRFLRQHYASPLLSYYAYVTVHFIIQRHPLNKAGRLTDISNDIANICVGCSRDIIDMFYKAGCVFFPGKTGPDAEFRKIHYETMRQVSSPGSHANPALAEIEEEPVDEHAPPDRKNVEEKAVVLPLPPITNEQIDAELSEFLELHFAREHVVSVFQSSAEDDKQRKEETKAYTERATVDQQKLMEQFRHSRALQGLTEQAAEGKDAKVFAAEYQLLLRCGGNFPYSKDSKLMPVFAAKLNTLGNQIAKNNLNRVQQELDVVHAHIAADFTEILKYVKDGELQLYTGIQAELRHKQEQKQEQKGEEKALPTHYQQHQTLIQKIILKLIGRETTDSRAFMLTVKPGVASTVDLLAFNALNARLTYFCNIYLQKYKEWQFWSAKENTVASAFFEAYKEKCCFATELRALSPEIKGSAFNNRVMLLIKKAKTYQEVESIRQLIMGKIQTAPPQGAGREVALPDIAEQKAQTDLVNLQKLCNARLRELHFTRVASTEPLRPIIHSWWSSDPEALAAQQDGLGREFSILPGGRPPTTKPYSSLYKAKVQTQLATQLEQGHPGLHTFRKLCQEIDEYKPFLGMGAKDWEVVKKIAQAFKKEKGGYDLDNYDINKPFCGPLKFLTEQFPAAMNQCSTAATADVKAPAGGNNRVAAAPARAVVAQRIPDKTGRYQKLEQLRTAYMAALDISEAELRAYQQPQAAGAGLMQARNE